MQPSINLHHLHLFYHVARHCGLSRALPHLPERIGAGALSGQLILLERCLGQRLFDRKPFRLLPAGRLLYRECQGFFERIPSVLRELERLRQPRLSIAASDLAYTCRLEPMLRRFCRSSVGWPGFISAVRRPPSELVDAVRAGTADLAIGEQPAHTRLPGLTTRVLWTARLAVILPAGSASAAARDLWADRSWLERLICPPAGHPVTEAFAAGMRQGGLDWSPLLEAPSPLTVATLAASGAGVGLTLEGVPVAGCARIRIQALSGFDPVTIVACWNGRGSALLRTLLDRLANARSRAGVD